MTFASRLEEQHAAAAALGHARQRVTVERARAFLVELAIAKPAALVRLPSLRVLAIARRQLAVVEVVVALFAFRAARGLLLERAVRFVLRDQRWLTSGIAHLLVAKHAIACPPAPAPDLLVRAALDLAVDPPIEIRKPARISADVRGPRWQCVAIGPALGAVAQEVANRVVRLAVARVVANRPDVRRRLCERLGRRRVAAEE